MGTLSTTHSTSAYSSWASGPLCPWSGVSGGPEVGLNLVICPFAVFHREIISEMGELGVLGPTIKGRDTFLSTPAAPYFPERVSQSAKWGCYPYPSA